MSDVPNGTLRYRIERLEAEQDRFKSEVRASMKELHDKLDRITLAIISGALAMSASLVAVAITIIARGG